MPSLLKARRGASRPNPCPLVVDRFGCEAWNAKDERAFIKLNLQDRIHQTMTSPALLTRYRRVRDVVGEIHQSATAVDEHLGRCQVYGDDEQMKYAMAEAERLSAHLQRLKRELRHCLPAANIVGEVEAGAMPKAADRNVAPNVQVAA